ncbi:hypothetical protein KJ570_03400 [Patescibacteria group bacterium]|nr:hypothetical protein [Patescibacteria group bacterium]MBU2036301.1 hypothetical protein [Patescibacteria group bacterium]
MEILVIILGSLTWAFTMIKSGIIYPFGMGFWGANGHDGIWHLAVIENLVKGKFSNPVFSGETLKNYHLGFDLIIALINKITSISTSVLYFQVFPIITALLIGILIYKFIFNWKKSKIQAIFTIFFVYFAGSFGWLVEFVRNNKFGGESMFWSQQAISTLINPPFSLSLIFIILGLIHLKKYIDGKKTKNLLFTVLFFGILIQIKAYAGVLVLLALFIAGIFYYFKNKDLRLFQVFSFSLILSLLIFLPFNFKSGNLFVFKPFWFLETMVGFKDRFNWERLYLALVQTKDTGFTVKALISYSLAFLIFIVGNFGTRIVGFLHLKDLFKKDKDSYIEIILFVMSLFGILIPLFFLQKGTAWNTIQFFYYSLFVFAIYSGLEIGKIFERNRNFDKYFTFFVVLLTIPTTFSTLYFHYLPNRPPAKLSLEELDALEFLSKEKDGIVLTYPYDSIKASEAEANPPRSLYLYESTAYVSAFSKKQLFLEDEVNLEITGYNWKERKEKVLDFINGNNREDSILFLKNNDISYLYFTDDQMTKINPSDLSFEEIYNNNQVRIYGLLDSKE